MPVLADEGIRAIAAPFGDLQLACVGSHARLRLIDEASQIVDRLAIAKPLEQLAEHVLAVPHHHVVD